MQHGLHSIIRERAARVIGKLAHRRHAIDDARFHAGLGEQVERDRFVTQFGDGQNIRVALAVERAADGLDVVRGEGASAGIGRLEDGFVNTVDRHADVIGDALLGLVRRADGDPGAQEPFGAFVPNLGFDDVGAIAKAGVLGLDEGLAALILHFAKVAVAIVPADALAAEVTGDAEIDAH